MHSDSWRAAGKTCRRRKPRGETETRLICESLPCATSCSTEWRLRMCRCAVCPQPQDGRARRSGGGKERGGGAQTNGKEEKKELIALNVFQFHSRGRTARLPKDETPVTINSIFLLLPLFGQWLSAVISVKELQRNLKKRRRLMHKPHRRCDPQLFTFFCCIIYFPLQSAQFTRVIYKIEVIFLR